MKKLADTERSVLVNGDSPILPPEEVHLLIVDDNPTHAATLEEAMERVGYQVSIAPSGEKALEYLEKYPVDIVITDLKLQDRSGLEILKKAKESHQPIEVILITGYASIESAVEAMRQGAFDYLEKPINLKILRARVAKAVEKISLVRLNQALRRQLQEKFRFEGIVGNSPKMKQVIEKLINIAPASDTTVLITGENGTGKELVAKTIHNNSPRKNHPFVVINCAAIPESLLESELFGTVPGAFTSAKARKGRIEYAHRGTLLLDEIGEMPLALQAKLLRVLEQKEITRLGSNESIRVDVRFLAATNVDLAKAIQEGKFRQDLYYRLQVVTIHLPPLRERREDIPVLVDHFLREFSEKHGKKVREISPKVREVFFRYSWPGNVRELRNCIESMVLTSQKEVLDVEDIPDWIRVETPPPTSSTLTIPPGYSMEEYEREIIRVTLEYTGGNRAEAAKILKIGERTLYRKIKKYGLG